MKLLTLISICAVGVVLICALAFGSKGEIISDDSTRASAIVDSAALQASAPGWSRGQQNLAISYDDCVRRMASALQAEGYRRDDQPGGNFAVGIKDPHAAVIICGPAPDNKMLVQIVVASNGDGGGHERQCLQAQMERPGTYNGCGGNNVGGASANVSYSWVRVGVGDCSGGDQAESNGPTPNANQAKAGRIAVCWDGNQYKHVYGGDSGRAFCTYKNTPPDQCRGGSNTGVMYQAVRR